MQLSDVELRDLDLSLQEAQHALAVEYAFEKWECLLAAVGPLRFEDLADLGFRADLSGAGREPDVVSKVEMRTQIGGLHGGRPLRLSMPVMIAPMSYGAISRSTKQAVAMASALSDIADGRAPRPSACSARFRLGSPWRSAARMRWP